MQLECSQCHDKWFRLPMSLFELAKLILLLYVCSKNAGEKRFQALLGLVWFKWVNLLGVHICLTPPTKRTDADAINTILFHMKISSGFTNQT